MLLDAASCEAHLFLPVQTEREARRDGWNWLGDGSSPADHGLSGLHPSSYLEEMLSRRRTGRPQLLHVRLSERTGVSRSRLDTAIYLARRQASSWGGQPTEDAWRIELLRRRYPYYRLEDICPRLDALRTIKSCLEIEALRRNAKLSAEAHRRAMAATRPGRFEYELEAEAVHAVLVGGAEGVGYAPIVGSGPNVNIWHYQDSARQLREGDLVVMDFGGSLGYLTIDITRTWPVSGRFDPLQERAYRCVLEAQKAIIAAMWPGADRSQTTEICRKVYERWGFADQVPSGAGHFVGMSVHDVGDTSRTFEPGMVIAVEPIIEIAAKQLHVRIEDTVLVTENGPEVLTAGVAKELDEVLALIGTGSDR
jgi:Xaa-Pro aminopeptidase